MNRERETANKRGYNYKWQKRRRIFLENNPLCVYCKQAGIRTAATVVDHIKPHRGNDKLFWDEDNWQPLCKEHHDSSKAKEEHKGYSIAVGLDGWPIDDEHPANKGSA